MRVTHRILCVTNLTYYILVVISVFIIPELFVNQNE